MKNIPTIYTLESSFAGVDYGALKGNHLTVQMLETLGRDVCRTLLVYHNLRVPPELNNLVKP